MKYLIQYYSCARWAIVQDQRAELLVFFIGSACITKKNCTWNANRIDKTRVSLSLALSDYFNDFFLLNICYNLMYFQKGRKIQKNVICSQPMSSEVKPDSQVSLPDTIKCPISIPVLLAVVPTWDRTPWRSISSIVVYVHRRRKTDTQFKINVILPARYKSIYENPQGIVSGQ